MQFSVNDWHEFVNESIDCSIEVALILKRTEFRLIFRKEFNENMILLYSEISNENSQ